MLMAGTVQGRDLKGKCDFHNGLVEAASAETRNVCGFFWHRHRSANEAADLFDLYIIQYVCVC